MTSHFIAISDLVVNGKNVFRFSDLFSVIVFYDGTDIRVVQDFCPHMGGPLSQGRFDANAGTITCPWHGYCFSMKSLTLQKNPNEEIWIKPLAGEKAAAHSTPAYRLKELPFRREADGFIIETAG